MIYGLHIIAGAALGKSISPIWLAGLIAFISHFILDWLPHWDYPVDSFKNLKPRTREFWRDAKWVVMDVGLAIVVVALILCGRDAKFCVSTVWLIALISWLPDLLVALAQVTKNKYLLKYFKFHHWVHNFKHTHTRLGMVFEVLVGLIFLGWLVL